MKSHFFTVLMHVTKSAGTWKLSLHSVTNLSGTALELNPDFAVQTSNNGRPCLTDIIQWVYPHLGVRSSVVGWGTMLQAGRSRDRIPDEVDFFKLPNPSSHTMALGSTQPLNTNEYQESSWG
jgi:hypothetical protein